MQKAPCHFPELYLPLVNHTMPDALFVSDEEGRLLDVNTKACASLGYSKEELLARSIPDIEDDFTLAELQALWKNLPDGESKTLYGHHRRKEGTSFPVEINFAAHTHNGRRLFMSVVRDITQRRNVEEALKRSEESFRQIYEHAPIGIAITNTDDHFLQCNPAYCELVGYTEAELKKIIYSELIHTDERTTNQREVTKLKNRETNFFTLEHRYLRKDGTSVWGEKFVALLPGAEPKTFHLLVLVSNIEKRKQIEAALQESEQRFRDTFEQAAVGIAHVATNGRWLRVNQKLCDILGYSHDEMIQLRFQDVTHAEDSVADALLANKILSGNMKTLSLEKRLLKKDRSIIWANITVSLCHKSCGELQHFITVFEDITQRKNTEAAIQALHSEMEQLTHFQVANQTVSAFAHELNQPLNAITSYAEASLRLIRSGHPNMEKLTHAITSSAAQAQRAGRVVRDFFTSTKQHAAQAAPTNIHAAIHEALFRIESDGYSTREIKLDMSTGLPLVLANQLQIEKVLVNLIENAIEAMKNTPKDSQSNKICLATHIEGDRVIITVEDQGPGMDDTLLSRIFDPFFTTKEKGLGMGLAICRSIIESHGGRLWVESRLGQGTRFSFSLRAIS